MKAMMKSTVGALIALAMGAATASGSADAQSQTTSALKSPAQTNVYEPMAYFAALDGRSYSARWKDKNETYTDVTRYEMILGGRALQSTHRITENGYGGRTIFFYDEAKKKYVYHYFTNGGFHTMGEATLHDGVLQSAEEVSGHSTIALVKAMSVFSPDRIEVRVVYVGKDGEETPTPARTYSPVADPGPLFP